MKSQNLSVGGGSTHPPTKITENRTGVRLVGGWGKRGKNKEGREGKEAWQTVESKKSMTAKRAWTEGRIHFYHLLL